ncbi:MAG: type II secretion system protein GspK [Phycisphaeraceae bacterium]|nr:type II secretion system protein GspK [Phycisphaeraceae bacterium]
MRATPRAHRGFATALVLWAVAIAALALAGLQLVASHQASAGREALARVRAHWAARAGVEATIARLQSEWEQAQPLGATSLLKDLQTVSDATLKQATFTLFSTTPTGQLPGPTDAHSKININLMTYDDLILLPGMSDEAANAILDWIDTDDDTRTGGAEAEAYASLPSPYKPRNGPVRSLGELELIRGVDPLLLRGEDWNLNSILDPNENDGNASWPPDNADGTLDAGWSNLITASSVSGGLSSLGAEKIDLTAAASTELVQALGITDQQAQTIIAQIQAASGRLEDFISTNLSTMAQTLQRNGQLTLTPPAGRPQRPNQGGRNQQQRTVAVPDLTRDQLKALVDQTQLGDPTQLTPGKLNINTADAQTFEYIAALTPTARDALLLYRDQMSGDITSLLDLLDVPGFNATTVASLWRVFDVRSNVFTLTSRGKDEISGLEVEMTVELDRSTDPVVIRSIVIR